MHIPQGLVQAVTKCSKDRHASVWRAQRTSGLLAERAGSSWGLDQIGLFQQIGVRKMAVSGWQKNETKCEGSQI